MVNEVKANLSGYTLRQDRITNLANVGGITSTELNIQIGSAENLAKGIIEIGDELMWVNSFDKTNVTLNVIPGFGRGYNNTTATSHPQNSQVTLTPTFPRSSIKNAINDTVVSLFPKLFAVGSTTFTFNASQTTYPLPDDCESVLYMSWQTTGSSQEWLPINRWRIDPMANFATFNTKNTINIYENIQPGRTIQVFYSKLPEPMTSTSNQFAATTGLPESCRDVIVFGASYRLLSYLDTGRINLTSAEADYNDSKLPSTAGATASKYLFALYQQRLQEEAIKLQDRFPIRIHYTK